MLKLVSISRFLVLMPKEDQELIKSLGLDTYTQLLKEADAENKDVTKRYENTLKLKLG